MVSSRRRTAGRKETLWEMVSPGLVDKSAWAGRSVPLPGAQTRPPITSLLCHQYMFRLMSRTDEEGLYQNILGCPHLQIHLKTPGVQDNADRSHGRILPAEGIFFTSGTTCLYQETLLQKRLDLRAERRSFWFPIPLNTDGRISAGVSSCVI